MKPLELLTEHRIIPVLRASSADELLRHAEILLEEGFLALELTFTTPNVLEAIKTLSQNKNVIIGAGTVLEVAQFKAALKAGAQFVVSPGVDVSLLEYAQDKKTPYYPGVFTASEVMCAKTYGFSVQKLFPAELHGTKHLKALRAPFPDVYFMPTGGVNAENLHQWASAGATAVGVGGNLIGDANPDGIRSRAKALKAAAREVWRTGGL
jgi:2-dehydro-3-deoxyphosphogluconate aldolase / (4S)-4-hydroxy-2-oxoglutarate aldolase